MYICIYVYMYEGHASAPSGLPPKSLVIFIGFSYINASTALISLIFALFFLAFALVFVGFPWFSLFFLGFPCLSLISLDVPLFFFGCP